MTDIDDGYVCCLKNKQQRATFRAEAVVVMGSFTPHADVERFEVPERRRDCVAMLRPATERERHHPPESVAVSLQLIHVRGRDL
mmetsp:Transcript_16782/g.45728  ORF Transcript_16782/g.45728 Transcript_16782/m.45728 type:complete len:84 (+) Transcript_16782:352-603(+)